MPSPSLSLALLLLLLSSLLPASFSTTLLLLETPFGIVASSDSRSSIPSRSEVVNPTSDKLTLITPRTLSLPSTSPFFCLALLRAGTTSNTQSMCRTIIEQAHSSSHSPASSLNAWPLISRATSLPPSASYVEPPPPSLTCTAAVTLVHSAITRSSPSSPDGAHGTLLLGYARSPPSPGSHEAPDPVSGVFEHLTRNSNLLDHSLSKSATGALLPFGGDGRSHEGAVASGSGGRDALGHLSPSLSLLRTDTFPVPQAFALSLQSSSSPTVIPPSEVAYIAASSSSILHAMDSDASSGGVARVTVVRRPEEEGGEGVVREVVVERRGGGAHVLSCVTRAA